MKRIFILLFFLASFGFYLRNVSPSVTAGDAGEFMTACATLSLAHAPSFPLYTVLSRCFVSLLPYGSLPFKCNVFSAFTSAGTLVMILLIGLAITKDVWISLLSAALAGLSTSMWENSLVTEVFALNSFLVVALIGCLLQAHRGDRRYYVLYAFVLGLGLGNHHILIFTVPAFLLCVAFDANRALVIQKAGLLILLGTIGFSIYLFLPIRSQKNPPLNWGQPTTVSKLARTITRKDYGHLTLALGESPARNWANTQRHLGDFVRHMTHEVPWPALLLGVAGFAVALRRKSPFSGMMLAVFVAAGPFFLLLGNLPFNGQSNGIIGRFYIMPVLAFLLGGLLVEFRGRRWAALVLLFCCGLSLRAGWAEASAHRSGTLVLDYGRAMLRTLPPQAALYMDGGDDAFYSLAMLHYALGKRPDVELHDRGGLVFRNPYGDDFRSLPKDLKPQRRALVEQSVLAQRPLFYSSMDLSVLPGARISPVGFLLEANQPATARISWPVIILRSLYPLKPNDYRTRALAAFFPFMQGQALWEAKNSGGALAFFNAAQQIGFDVDWLRMNLSAEYARLGYEQLLANNYPVSERIYRQWLAFDPLSEQANSNLGVVYEREGRLEEAKAQYERAARLFPSSADPVFNLAVLSWRRSDWPEVVRLLEEVIRRKPDHPQAQNFLRSARQKSGQ